MLEVPIQDGGSILVEVEVDDIDGDGVVPAGRPGELAAKASMTLEAALEEIRPAAEVVVGKLRTLSSRPDDISVTFGIKLSAKAGAFIASSGLDANFGVELRWSRNA